MFNCIEGLGAVKKAPVDNTSVPEIVIYGLVDNPRAQGCIAVLLKSKLKLIATKKVAVDEDYPIQKLQNQGAYRYRSVIL